MNAPAQAGIDPIAALTPEQVQDRDWLHLKLLVIFLYTVGGLALAGGLDTLLIVLNSLLGMFESSLYEFDPGGAVWEFILAQNPLVVLVNFAGIPGGMLSISAGRKVRDRRSYGFLRKWSVWQWFLLFPEGIPLGICLGRVLKRSTVKSQFALHDL